MKVAIGEDVNVYQALVQNGNISRRSQHAVLVFLLFDMLFHAFFYYEQMVMTSLIYFTEQASLQITIETTTTVNELLPCENRISNGMFFFFTIFGEKSVHQFFF